jgi:UDP-N-acetylmuramyl pentapeptide phosphotransferase/UDP-N-acetylglucosamine-1-phosphate transferase
MIVLALLSWQDDMGLVAPEIRLAFQIAAITSVLYFLPREAVVFGDVLPLWADRLITGFCWLWFINLFNFMDGIDGIAGTQTLFICVGIVIIGVIVGFPTAFLNISTVIAAAAAGFLWWNWSPAKIMLGDIGAITLGFILGWLLIRLAMAGQLAAAFILPLYFLADSTLTILLRIYRRERFWQPHKTHFYQRTAEALQSHATVVLRIAIANFALLGAAILSVFYPLAGIALGVATVTLLMVHFHRIFRS